MNEAVVRATWFPIETALARTVHSTRGVWKERAGVVLVLTDASGREGVGEASPLPGYSPETLEEATLEIEAWARDQTLPTVPSALFAIETALVDLEAQQRGCSMAEIFAGPAARSTIPLSALLEGPEDLAGADRALARGISTLKVKLGVYAFPDELDELIRLRRHIGPNVALRLDAGGAWDIDEARHYLEKLAKAVAPELCEEPVSGPLLLELGPTAVPWAADESLIFPVLADHLLDAPGCAAFVLKPALLGGFERCLALARKAEKKNISVIVTHLFDGPWGLNAARELARAVPGKLLPCGLDSGAELTRMC